MLFKNINLILYMINKLKDSYNYKYFKIQIKNIFQK